MLKILQIFNYYQPDFTGEGIYFEKIEKLFRRDGISSEVLVMRTRTPAKTDAADCHGLPVTYLGLTNKSAPLQSLYLACWLVRNLRRYDIVHFHAPTDRYFATYILSALFGVRVMQSCTLNDSPDNVLRSYNPKVRWFIVRLLRLVEAFVLISPKLLLGARRTMPEDKLKFIPQGVSLGSRATTAREEVRREFGYTENDVVLLFVGGICERKGVDFLVETFPDLLAHNSQVRLLIVGPDLEDEYADALRCRVVALGLQDQVRFTGALYELDSIYQLSDIMAFASHQEGFGNVLLEAMAHGRPVVSRRLAGVTDYFIEHGTTGYLFEDESQYVDSMKNLIDDQEKRQSMGCAARRVVEEKFELSLISTQYVDLYKSGAS